MAILVAGTNILIQSSVMDAMRGRVMGGWHLLSRGAGAIGSLVMGTLAELYGFTGPFLCVSVIGGLYVLWMFSRRDRLVQALERE